LQKKKNIMIIIIINYYDRKKTTVAGSRGTKQKKKKKPVTVVVNAVRLCYCRYIWYILYGYTESVALCVVAILNIVLRTYVL